MTSDRSSCLSCCNYSAGGYGRRRLCILVVLAVFVALLMFSAGFVAGWYASQLQHQQSSDSAAGPVGNDTGKSHFVLVCLCLVSRSTLVYLRFVLRAANTMIALCDFI